MGKASRERRRRIQERQARPGAPSGRGSSPSGGAPRAEGAGAAFGASFRTEASFGAGTGGASASSRPSAGQDPSYRLAATLDAAVSACAHGPRVTADRYASMVAQPQDWGLDAATHRRLAERLLRTRLVDDVARTWRDGWQPADVVRYARRELPISHVRLLGSAIASQLSQYAPDTVDPTWAQQLEDAEIAMWWRPGESFLTATETVWPGRWPELVLAVVEVLAFTHRLGPLPLIGPVPGQGRVNQTAVRSDVDERMLARVRALLAKAESTNYPAEAETFTAGAQKLMARHSIDAALLAATAHAPRTDVASLRIGVDNPYEGAKASLLSAVAQANRCQAVWVKQYGFMSVVGFRSDLDAVEVLFTSLLVQATTGLNAAGSQSGAGSHNRSRTFRQSFLIAFAHRIGERLTEATDAETRRASAESGSGNLLPVLASRAQAVQDAVTEMFPKTVAHRAGSVNDAAGWAQGRAAADLASLHTGAPLQANTG